MSVVEMVEAGVRRKRGSLLPVSLTVEAGDRVALFGGPGAGKSTVLALASGRLAPDCGVVRVLGRSPRPLPRWVGVAGGETGQGHAGTVEEALERAAARGGVPPAERRERIDEAVDLLRLDDCRDRPFRELSGCQHAAAALAAALAHRPALLLLDAATAGLPEPLAARLWAHLDARRASDGLAVLHATTSSGEAEQADRVLLLEDGRVLADAAPADLLALHAPDTLTIESTDPDAVRRTLRGIFDVEIAETPVGLRIRARDGTAAAAHLMRHPTGGVRTVFMRRPTLWDVLRELARPAVG